MDEVAIITGGTKGLGRAMVLQWLAEGWRVATCARDEAELAKLEQEVLGDEREDRLMTHTLDVSDPIAVRSLVTRVHDRWSRIDVLVNNASILGPRTTIEEYPEEVWREVMEINVNGPFYFAQEVIPIMRETKLKLGASPVILNISSGAGARGKARWGAYAASKFAIEGMSQVLRDELIEEGIRVHAVDPGAMRTSMRAAAYPNEDPESNPAPETIARVLFDIATVFEPQMPRLVAKEYL